MWKWVTGLVLATMLATPCLAANPACTQPLTGRWAMGANWKPFEKFISSTDDEIHGLVGKVAIFSPREIRMGKFHCFQPMPYDDEIKADGKGNGLYTGDYNYITRKYACKKGSVLDIMIGEDCNRIHAFAGHLEAFELTRLKAAKH